MICCVFITNDDDNDDDGVVHEDHIYITYLIKKQASNSICTVLIEKSKVCKKKKGKTFSLQPSLHKAQV